MTEMNWEFKINPPSFNDFINNNNKIKLNLNPIEIKNLNENFKSIQNKNFSMTIKDKDNDINITNHFMKWFYMVQGKGFHKENNKIVFRKLTKPYPYKSKKKRIINKWWKNHSELITLNNVEFDIGERNEKINNC